MGRKHFSNLKTLLLPIFLERSLSLIKKATPGRTASVIDVGGGESTLSDDLLDAGYRDAGMLDISRAAIGATRRRFGAAGNAVQWHVGGVTPTTLPAAKYDVSHDRAAFHFLTDDRQRSAYVRLVMQAVEPGGHVIVATFGPEGSSKCSGLDVVRYDADELHNEFGDAFALVESATELHQTPSGTSHQFIDCYCVKSAGISNLRPHA